MSSWRERHQMTVFKYKVGKVSLPEDGTARGCAADLRGTCRDLIRDESEATSSLAFDLVTKNGGKSELLMML